MGNELEQKSPGRDGQDYERVNHPKHYNEHPAGVECIDVIEHFQHNIGAAIKYLWRQGLKPGERGLDDLRKAQWYVNREIERVTKQAQKDGDRKE